MGSELTGTELLGRVPVGGKRPEATLKRLRRGGLLPKPIPHSLGRGRGVVQIYPVWAEERLRRILALRSDGVRSVPELRWWLWLEGADDLWPRVQADLLAAYPREDQASLEEMQANASEELTADVDMESTVLAKAWANPRHRGYDRRAVRDSVEVETLAHVAIGAGIDGEEPYLSAPLDNTESEETVGDLVDRAWGQGSAMTLDRAINAGVLDPSPWGPGLASASADEARLAAILIGQGLSHPELDAEMKRFGAPWTNRALLVAASLFAIQRSFGP